LAGAIALVLLIVRLPKPWQDAAILFWLIGMPMMIFVLRILRHAVDVELARLSREPEPPRATIPKGVGGRHESDGLHVVEVGTSDAGQVRL